jgi:hypothetical protein
MRARPIARDRAIRAHDVFVSKRVNNMNRWTAITPRSGRTLAEFHHLTVDIHHKTFLNVGFFSTGCAMVPGLHYEPKEESMKLLLAGSIFVVTVLIAFSEVAPSIGGIPPLELAMHDLIASVRLR